MSTNTGFGTGMNAGVARARELGASWFLLLNPDVVIGGAEVRELHDRAVRARNAVVAPVLLRPDGSIWSRGADLYLDDGSVRSVAKRDPRPRRREFWLSGACLLIGADLWDQCGGFADDYFLYWEDVELSRRVRRSGGALILADDVTATHAAGGTQGAGQGAAGTPKSPLYYYYNTRNRLLFAVRNLEDDDVRAWVRAAVPAARAILLRGGRRQLLRSWRPLWAVWRGTRDGRRLARAALSGRSQGGPTIGASGATSSQEPGAR